MPCSRTVSSGERHRRVPPQKVPTRGDTRHEYTRTTSRHRKSTAPSHSHDLHTTSANSAARGVFFKVPYGFMPCFMPSAPDPERAVRLRGAPRRGEENQETQEHTGIVCENMHALGANLRKLPGQAKICTPPGGAVVAKICKLSHFSDRGFTNSPIQTRETVESTHLQNIIARRLGAATFYRRGNFVAGAVQFGSLLVFLLDLNFLVSL